MATRTVSVDLVANVGQYQSSMVRAASATRTVGTEATTAGTKAQRGFDMAGRGAAILGTVLAGGVAIGLKRTVDLASDAEQSMGGVQAVFKEYAQTVVADSQAADRALGLSANSYRELATIIGSQMKNAGVPMEELAARTDNLITIGADLAAQFGGSTQDAVNALSSALRGELDPIERYGISLTAAAVGAKAVEMGLASSATELDQNAKLMATLAIVTEQSADAQGAFARESDTAAGRAARAAAQWENLQTAIGEKLLPAWSALMDFVGTTVIPGLETVGGAIGAVTGFFGDNMGVAAALAAVLAVQLVGGLEAARVGFNRLIVTNAVLGVSSLLDVVLDLPGAMRTAGTAIGGFLAAAAPLVAVGAVVYAIGKVYDFATAAGDARQEIEGMWDAVGDAPPGGRLEALEAMADELAAKIKVLKAELSETLDLSSLFSFGLESGGNLERLEEYERALGNVRAAMEDTTPGFLGLQSALDGVREVTAGAAEATVAAAEDAEEAYQDWLDSLQKASEGFIDPLATYQGLLDAKMAKERESAEATAAATASGKDSWEDYVGEVSVSLAEYAQALEDQIAAQEDWQTNLVTIAQRGGTEVATILAEMGVEGAQITAEMASATEEDFQRMRTALLREAQLAGDSVTGSWATDMRAMELIGRDGSQRTVQEVARQLGVGVSVVREIARKYGIELAGGVNPLLRGLGKPGINISDYSYNSGGGRADGGFINGWSPHARADNILTPTTAGEHVQPVKRVKQYGGDLFEAFRFGRIDVKAARSLLHPGRADGGFISSSQVPKPPSTAPYRSPISPPADETMARAYGDTVDWVNANSFTGALGPGSAGTPGQWQAMFAAVQAQFPDVRLHSGFRPGSITATGNLSYHALGRAIDISPRADIFNWIKGTYGSRIRELIFSPMGSGQVWNGRNHYYSEPTRGDHWDHIHWAMRNGGVIGEPVIGRGMWSGGRYSFAEQGPETVQPGVRSREFSGAIAYGGGGGSVTVNIEGARIVGTMDLGGGLEARIDGRIVQALTSGSRRMSAQGVRG